MRRCGVISRMYCCSAGTDYPQQLANTFPSLSINGTGFSAPSLSCLPAYFYRRRKRETPCAASEAKPRDLRGNSGCYVSVSRQTICARG